MMEYLCGENALRAQGKQGSKVSSDEQSALANYEAALASKDKKDTQASDMALVQVFQGCRTSWCTVTTHCLAHILCSQEPTPGAPDPAGGEAAAQVQF